MIKYLTRSSVREERFILVQILKVKSFTVKEWQKKWYMVVVQKTEAPCSYLGGLGSRARKERGQVIISLLATPNDACLCFISAVVIKYFAKSNI